MELEQPEGPEKNLQDLKRGCSFVSEVPLYTLVQMVMEGVERTAQETVSGAFAFIRSGVVVQLPPRGGGGREPWSDNGCRPGCEYGGGAQDPSCLNASNPRESLADLSLH